jgi:hypothetical protein
MKTNQRNGMIRLSVVAALVVLCLNFRPAIAQEATNLSFDDFKFKIKKGEKFEKSMIHSDITKYEGKRIVIRGYIRPSFKQNDLKQFILVRDNMECCFGPGAMLYDCMIVRMQKGKSTNFTVRPIAVEGEFKVREFKGPDGKPWAVYELKGISVK